MRILRTCLTLAALAAIGLTAGTASADLSFQFTTDEQVGIGPLGQFHAFEAYIYNDGTENDTYTIFIAPDVPASWSASVCAEGTCYPPFQTEISVTTAVGEIDTILVDMLPLAEEGDGTLSLTVRSDGDPALNANITFKLISSGVEVLMVDGAGGADYQGYYDDALAATGLACASWEIEEYGPIGAEELGHFPRIVWFTGTGTLSVTDRDAMAEYLGYSGRVLLSGQNIAYDIFDPAGGSYGPEAQGWAEDYFGIGYLADDANDDAVNGAGGDPVGDGLAFVINGGDGANNNTSPDLLEIAGSGIACLVYGGGGEAGVRLDGGNFHTVFCGFGFEGIADQSSRDMLMTQTLAWFTAGATSVPGDVVSVPIVSTPLANPNPFNPNTSIEFEVSGERTLPLEIVIYDLRGQLVRSLYQGEVNPGAQSYAWDGRTDTGRSLATGIYLARVSTGGLHQTVKMTLVK